MIRIAVAAEGGKVAGHFGHCESFMMYDAENGVILKEECVQNPGHKPGFLPNFLADRGVNVIISGGMGQGAADIFIGRGIEIATGAAGLAKDAAMRYLDGGLKPSFSACREHSHHS